MSNPTKLIKIELVTGTFLVQDLYPAEGNYEIPIGPVIAAGSARSVCDTIKEQLEAMVPKDDKPAKIQGVK